MIADDEGVLAEGAIGVQGDNAVVVAAFADESAARDAYYGLIDREIAGVLDIEGVLVARADETGKVHIVKMTDHKTRDGFLAGAVAGAVVGDDLPRPASSPARCGWASAGPRVGKLGNVATKSAAAKELASVLDPGLVRESSALATPRPGRRRSRRSCRRRRP